MKTCKIVTLSQQQRAQVDSWWRQGLIYAEIARRIKTAFGVSIGTNSLSRFYSKQLALCAGSIMIAAGPINLPNEQAESQKAVRTTESESVSDDAILESEELKRPSRTASNRIRPT